MKDTLNSIITENELNRFKNGEKVQSIDNLFHEISLSVVTTILEEFKNGGLDLETVNENKDLIRLKIIGKTKYKTIEDYINLYFPFIVCKRN